MTRVAITQPNVIYGGRLQVLLAIAETLNDLGLRPDLLTWEAPGAMEEFEAFYGVRVDCELKVLPRPFFAQRNIDWKTVWFNRALRGLEDRYDLFINSSNSLACLPRRTPVLSYINFPREYRARSPLADVHHPERPLRWLSGLGARKLFARGIYAACGVTDVPRHRILFNSKFTREAGLAAYPDMEASSVLHPPVLEPTATASTDKKLQVISLGRFAAGKRQDEQIRVASRLPDVDFHIVGFITDRAYYDACCRLRDELGATNVSLHTAMTSDELQQLFAESKYFLHTLVNEPFGITAVQAMFSGCIPIVHDSGGQCETVRDPRFRYSELEEVPHIIGRTEAMSAAKIDRLREENLELARSRFSWQVFKDAMREEIAQLLEGTTEDTARELQEVAG